MAKPRNWIAVHAHFRRGGAHKQRSRPEPQVEEWDADEWRDLVEPYWDGCLEEGCWSCNGQAKNIDWLDDIAVAESTLRGEIQCRRCGGVYRPEA